MSGADAAPGWLLAHRATVPGPPPGYCDRPALTARCDLLGRPVTALVAPGGFGKTTALAAACRAARDAGAPVAWLALDDDDPPTLDAYLAFAFRRAGIDVDAELRDRGPSGGPLPPRTAVLLRALERRDRPVVLALDELERLADAGSVAVLGRLLRHAPPCLRLALAYRALPPGLDAAVRILDARFATADDLRFSTPDIARFFGLALTPRRLGAVAAETRGWPIALRTRRNAPAVPPAAGAAAVHDAVGSWIAGSFWRAVADADRQLVLDLALFEWIDRGLADAVFDVPGTFDRAVRLPALAGLLQPARGARGTVHRLHPLLREHGAETLRREQPERRRRLLRRLAAALAERGAVVDAMRHAAEAGDHRLAGAVLLDAGGLAWWLREGADRLATADRLLSDAALAGSPRLAFFRSAALLFGGHAAEAGRVYRTALAAEPPPGDPAYHVDRLIAGNLLAFTGATRVDPAALRRALDEGARTVAVPTASRLVRGAFAYAHATLDGRAARFEAAVERAREARRLVVGRSAYLAMRIDSFLAEVAMARGRVREARRYHASARRVARDHFLQDPRLTAFTDLMARELALERNRAAERGDHRRIARDLFRGGYLFASYAAADLVVALETDAGGAAAGLALADDLAEGAHAAGLPAAAAFLAMHRVVLLLDAGRTAEAEAAWQAAAPPHAREGLPELAATGWRETEAFACARIRLLAALGRTAEAADLERALAEAAERHGLTRTLMRSLALRARLAHEVRDRAAAEAAVRDYLARFARADYARPLLAAGDAATAALGRIADAEPDGPLAAHARRLLAMGGTGRPAAVRLHGRELAVLRLLGTRQDKEIARLLGLSRDGVRYRVRKIFRQLDVGCRRDAVRRAVALGLLPDDAPLAAP